MSENETIDLEERLRLLPILRAHRCITCGWCVLVCPTDCLAQSNGLPEIVRPADCTFCAVCAVVCPTQALEMPEPSGAGEQPSRPPATSPS